VGFLSLITMEDHIRLKYSQRHKTKLLKIAQGENMG